MKTFAIVLVLGVAGYAIYDLFKGNSLFSAALTSPGTISGVGTSVPGVPIYSQLGTTASNAAGAATSLATLPTEFTAAFGPSDDFEGNDDLASLTSGSTGSSSYDDFTF